MLKIGAARKLRGRRGANDGKAASVFNRVQQGRKEKKGLYTFLKVGIILLSFKEAMRRTKEEALKTREAILQMALECFSTRGYALTTFADIAARLHLTKGAVFWYFKSKEALLAEIIQRMQAQYEPFKGIEAAVSLDEVKAIFMRMAHEIATNEEQRNFLRFIISRVEWSEALKDKLCQHLDELMVRDPFSRLQECIERLKQSGEIASPLTSKSIAVMMNMTFFGSYREAFLRDRQINVQEVLSAGLDFIIQGIRSK